MATPREYVEQAAKYIGSGGNLFNDWAGLQRGTAWCATFQGFVGIHDLGMKWRRDASAAGFAAQFRRIDDSEVQAGDMVFFNWNGIPKVAWDENSHVAVVESFNHSTGMFTVIEGNGSGSLCRRTTYNNNATYFTAFFRPEYDTEGDKLVPPYDWVRRLQFECNLQGFSEQPEDGVPGPVTLAGCCPLRKGDEGNITHMLQEILEHYGYYCGGADGVFGAWTEGDESNGTGVRGFQKARGLAVDGWVGQETWAEILGL